jgi:hypothetical protein
MGSMANIEPKIPQYRVWIADSQQNDYTLEVKAFSMTR